MKCCFCKNEIIGVCNDVRPLIIKRNAMCCDNCNRDIIVRLRMLESISYREHRSMEQKKHLAGE